MKVKVPLACIVHDVGITFVPSFDLEATGIAPESVRRSHRRRLNGISPHGQYLIPFDTPPGA
jgi:hypothetical protein